MEESPGTPATSPRKAPALKPAGLPGLLWECATKALIRTILLLVLWSVASGLLHGMFHEMTPGAPPTLTQTVKAEAEPGIATAGYQFWNQHRFGIVWTLLFAGHAAVGLGRYSPHAKHHRVATYFRAIGRLLLTHWFSLFVGNAFGAFIGAIIWKVVKNFTFGQWLSGLLLQLFGPAIHGLLGIIPGGHTLEDLLGWYGQNEVKFAFWFFYLTAICDDLGIPNLKSLGRWILRQVQQKWGVSKIPQTQAGTSSRVLDRPDSPGKPDSH